MFEWTRLQDSDRGRVVFAVTIALILFSIAIQLEYVDVHALVSRRDHRFGQIGFSKFIPLMAFLFQNFIIIFFFHLFDCSVTIVYIEVSAGEATSESVGSLPSGRLL